MTIAAIINTDSGSVPRNAEETILGVLSEFGHESDVRVITGSDLHDTCVELASTRADCLIAWGGDGTLACALNSVSHDGASVIVLPGGTMNLLSKRIHGELSDPEEILRTCLSKGVRQHIPAIEVGGQKIYVGIMVGEATRLAEAREYARKGDVPHVASTLVETDVLDTTTRIRINAGTEADEATALAAFVPDQPDHQPNIYYVNPENIIDLVRMGFDSLLGDWANADGVMTAHHETFRLEALKGEAKIPAALDGEPTELSLPCEIKLIRKAAGVLSARSA